MAASHAPVVEPSPAGTQQGNGSVLRKLSPAEAEQVAHRASADRIRRTNTSPHKREPAPIPSLPPGPKSPTNLTPVLLVFAQMIFDVVSIVVAFSGSYWLRFGPDIIERRQIPPDVTTYFTMLAVTVGTILATFYFSRLYNLKRGASRVDEFYKIAASVSIGTVLSLATNSLILGDLFIYSRQILLMGWLFTIVMVGFMRLLYSALVGQLRKHGIDRSRVLVVGTGLTARVVVERLSRHTALGYQVVGVIEPGYVDRPTATVVAKVPVIGNLQRLAELVRRQKVDEVIVAIAGASDRQLRDILGLLQDESVSIKIYPDAFQLMTQNEVSVGELSGLPLLSVKDVALRGWNRLLKRAFDIAFSSVVLVLTAPVMLLIALAVKLNSQGPVFFIQERVGLDGNAFPLVKFRTMRTDVPDDVTPRLGEGMPGWTVRNDPRRTTIGSILRRFSLDELPQFYNVLVGEMSIVGPRPEQPAYVHEFAQRIPQYLRRHREKAGITGWAQVNGLRGDTSIELRTAADLYYVEHWSLLFDLKIIVRTLVAMFRGKNAY